jgi:hypothetical protein
VLPLLLLAVLQHLLLVQLQLQQPQQQAAAPLACLLLQLSLLQAARQPHHLQQHLH